MSILRWLERFEPKDVSKAEKDEKNPWRQPGRLIDAEMAWKFAVLSVRVAAYTSDWDLEEAQWALDHMARRILHEYGGEEYKVKEWIQEYYRGNRVVRLAEEDFEDFDDLVTGWKEIKRIERNEEIWRKIYTRPGNPKPWD